MTTNRALQALLDKQAILDLLHAYCQASDRRDLEKLRSLYHGDAIDDHGAFFKGLASEFIEQLPTIQAPMRILHHNLTTINIVLDNDGADDCTYAEGEVYVSAYHRIRDENGGLSDYVGGFRYLDQYRLEAGSWRFARRKLIIDWCTTAPAFWNPNQPWLPGTPIGTTDSNDQSYALNHPVFARRSVPSNH